LLHDYYSSSLFQLSIFPVCASFWKTSLFDVFLLYPKGISDAWVLVLFSGLFAGVVDLIEGSLEVKLPTIWTDEKQSREEAGRRKRLEERRVRRKKMQMREKVGKSRNTVFFQ
jgi:hypothetical protein